MDSDSRVSVAYLEAATGILRDGSETADIYVDRVGDRLEVDDAVLERAKSAFSKPVTRAAALPDREAAAIERFYTCVEEMAEPGGKQDVHAVADGTGDAGPDHAGSARAAGDRTGSGDGATSAPASGTYQSGAGRGDGADTTEDDGRSDRRLGSGVRSGVARFREGHSHRRVRVIALTLVLVLSAPLAVSAMTYSTPGTTAAGNVEGGNITFVTTQGTEPGQGGGVFAVKSTSDEVVWSMTEFTSVYDVDPLTDDTILVAAFVNGTTGYGDSDSWNWYAVRINWRTGEVIEKVPIPVDTHDVDYLGDGEYIVAEKEYGLRWDRSSYRRWVELNRDRGWIAEDREHTFGRIYIYNSTVDDIVWEYRFADRFSRQDGRVYEGDGPWFLDWTHVNDVDVVDDGSAILASPRNFDRVLLIDRATKETRWVLGEEDDHDVLKEQHNPTLLSLSPPTVLVADSENDRVIEYRRTATGWESTWIYEGDLNWPRDADRLPNGNTLIVDTNGDRVLEVTPGKTVAWELDVREKELGPKPYDVERLAHGDEPQGPPMHQVREPTELDTETSGRSDGRGSTSVLEEWYVLASWVLPPWVEPFDFALIHLLLTTLLGWGYAEVAAFRS